MTKGSSFTAPAVPLCKRDRTRLQLVQSALEVIATRGLEGTSIDDLVRSAGMARGTFYNYFQGRDEVFHAVDAYIWQAVHEGVELRIDATAKPEVIVACMAYGFLRFARERPTMGWAMVRIGGGMRSLIAVGQYRYPIPDSALEKLLPDGMTLVGGLSYLGGGMLMTLRRLLEDAIDMREAEGVLGMVLRGLGVTPRCIRGALSQAREFAATLEAPSPARRAF